MKHRKLQTGLAIGVLIAAAMMGASCLSAAPPAAAPPAAAPPYVILQARPSEGAAVSTPAQRYSYGWFGAAPRKHARRHFGYHRNYTQWSWR